MKLYLCCWRKGNINNLEDDIEFSTVDSKKYERWFEGVKDPKFRTYSLEYDVETNGNLVSRYPVFRGGPGV
jgi:hypothetical protein